MSSTYEDPSVGQRLQEVRKSAELSQQAFANLLGISLRTYQNYERGERPVSKELLCALHEKAGVTPNQLLLGQDGSEPESGEIDAELIREIVRLVVESGRGLRVSVMPSEPEELAYYAALIYGKVCHLGDAGSLKTAIDKEIRYLYQVLARNFLLMNPDLDQTGFKDELPTLEALARIKFAPGPRLARDELNRFAWGSGMPQEKEFLNGGNPPEAEEDNKE